MEEEGGHGRGVAFLPQMRPSSVSLIPCLWNPTPIQRKSTFLVNGSNWWEIEIAVLKYFLFSKLDSGPHSQEPADIQNSLLGGGMGGAHFPAVTEKQ